MHSDGCAARQRLSSSIGASLGEGKQIPELHAHSFSSKTLGIESELNAVSSYVRTYVTGSTRLSAYLLWPITSHRYICTYVDTYEHAKPSLRREWRNSWFSNQGICCCISQSGSVQVGKCTHTRSMSVGIALHFLSMWFGVVSTLIGRLVPWNSPEGIPVVVCASTYYMALLLTQQ